MCYNKSVLSVKVSKDNLLRLKEDFKDYIIEENVGYILFVAKKDGYMITAYDNKNKNYNRVTFQGPDPLKIASIYSDDVNSIPKKKKISKESPIYIDVDFQIGSDEVGTGDFLGPIVVCAGYVDEETMKIIEEYHISDSKKLRDKQILNFLTLILKKVSYEAKDLTNE